ncbi:hypothetical protein Ccrd_026617 [Cynara cardunculus var. scolymus]|uniref:Uncharacterized protein n=1 Tax=Cynara cardunculus var. scolymus TaxID=59895 RepID=A0A118GG61_CYNCS|nr:hypothetical protein Ccrd_026617 [Cynara cardunculus var. scolymus]
MDTIVLLPSFLKLFREAKGHSNSTKQSCSSLFGF